MSEWKVDPDNRRRLLQLQKLGGNKKCVDCGGPNPQWASPKFGIFICLECAGIHRSLGVHISFVRSITMDQFKPEELSRMEKGGNEPFNEYMSSHGIDLKLPHKLKYDNLIAQDYKEKLTCLVEGMEFVEPEHPDFDPSQLTASDNKEVSEKNNLDVNRQQSPLESRRSPRVSIDKKDKNEAYFAELGKKNQTRPEHLPPSQGGKYTGFGNTPANANGGRGGGEHVASNTINLQNLQADPLGTFSKGWGLFSSAITKSFEEVNESVIKPGYQQWQSGELSEDAKRAASQFGQKFQETSTYGIEALTSFTKNLQLQYGPQAGGQSPGPNFEKADNETGESLLNSEKKEKKSEADEWDQF